MLGTNFRLTLVYYWLGMQPTVITSRIKTKQGTVKNISALGMHVNGDHEKTSVVGGRLIVLIN